MDISLLHNDRDLFSVLELCDPQEMAHALGVELQVESNQTVIAEALTALLITGAQQVSGQVLEPEWGLGAYTQWARDSSLEKPPGLVLRLDAPVASEVPVAGQLPVMSPDWGVEHVANNYALAFIELKYHPQEAEALAKKQLVAELYDFCRNQGTELIVKLVLADPSGAEVGPEMQLTAVQELRGTAHLLALEVPREPLAVATLTAELDIPWIATPGPNHSFPQFGSSLGQALENGAQGFLVGQTAWADISQLKRADQAADMDQVKTFINTTFRERLQALNQMLAEMVRV